MYVVAFSWLWLLEYGSYNFEQDSNHVSMTLLHTASIMNDPGSAFLSATTPGSLLLVVVSHKPSPTKHLV